MASPDPIPAILPPPQLSAGLVTTMTPPVFPNSWRASVLLTPFGDAAPPMSNYDQLVVADVKYGTVQDIRSMRVSLYLLESLTYYDFLFTSTASGSTEWFWLDSRPNQQGPVPSYGPFATPLQVPAPNFLLQQQAVYGNSWNIMGFPCDAWVVPADNPPTYGTWFSFTQNNLIRILNITSSNACQIPILGSYYLVNVPRYSPPPAAAEAQELQELVALVKGGQQAKAATYTNPMVTQRDIQTALAKPLASASCTLPQIQALIPGIQPTPSAPLPQWTDQTYIQGWTIGTDFIPYYTLVYYWWSYKHQRTQFIGYGNQPGKSTYNDRQDTVLYAEYTTNPVYAWQNNQWQKTGCNPCLNGVGIPRPDFVAADGGVMKASITGNPAFGLGPQQTLYLIKAPMPRSATVLSLFWFWFTADQKGVLFSECEFTEPLAHDLQVIDYDVFQQNATWITAANFSDPCYVPNCTGAAAATTTARRAPIIRHNA